MMPFIGGPIRLDKMSRTSRYVIQLFFMEAMMDLLTGNVKKLFFRYLTAAFGSALIVAIYSIVDSAMVGQYCGPAGVAALATVAPMWNIIYSLGLLFGIGGAVLMSTARGSGNKRQGDQLFTVALLGAGVMALLMWVVLFLWDAPLLRLFGADDTLLPLAQSYLFCVKLAAPLFLFGQFLAAFLRNDNAPARATAAVLTGGIFNIIGDYVLVFVFNLGIFGAGLATAMGQVLAFCVLLSHFFTKNCTLRLARPGRLLHSLGQVVNTGFSTFFIDIAMGILSLMFNNQIMHWAGADALAVYGVIINVNVLVQSCAYGVGQAAQPLISVNFGAHRADRIGETFRWSMLTTGGLSLLWTALTMAFPMVLVGIFMQATPEVTAIAPGILQRYFLSFLLLPLNIYSTYYFQAILKPMISFWVSVLRGMLLSGCLIYVLPLAFGGDALWWAMPITELVIAVPVLVLMCRSRRQLAQAWQKNGR